LQNKQLSAVRGRAQMLSRAEMNSSRKLYRYPAPRKAAVSGGLIVHEKYTSVFSESRKKEIPTDSTRKLANF